MLVNKLNWLNPNEVVNPSFLEEYEKQIGIFKDDLIYLHTNLNFIRQINEFDHELFQSPIGLWQYLTNGFFTYSLLIICRLWADSNKKTITLDKFAKQLLKRGIKPIYRKELKERINEATPEQEKKENIEGMRKIRHARIAHISRKVQLNLTTPPKPVPFENIISAADFLGNYFNAMSFGTTWHFVPLNFLSEPSKWHEGDLGYLLDKIALDSKWFELPEKHPDLWTKLRKSLTKEQMDKINEVRLRYRMNPLI